MSPLLYLNQNFFCYQGERGVEETQNEPPPSEFRTFFAAREREGWWRLKLVYSVLFSLPGRERSGGDSC